MAQGHHGKQVRVHEFDGDAKLGHLGRRNLDRELHAPKFVKDLLCKNTQNKFGADMKTTKNISDNCTTCQAPSSE